MIKVNNLGFTYPGAGAPAVNNISFQIPRGQIFGFLGPSGAGKSTVQKILFGLLPGYTGSVMIENKDLKHWGKTLYEKIGVCFELPNHYLKLTARENLDFFRGFYPSSFEPDALFKMVGLEKDADKKVSDYSKGMKMRLNFIRSFIHDPDILFLDEPTSGLDPVNARVVKDIILDLKKKGKTIFITTHQMHDAEELCDTVAFLTDGTIKALDAPANLKEKYSRQTLVLKLKDNSSHEFPMADIGVNEKFLSLLKNNEPASLHSMEAGLEEIFILLTGKKL